MNISMNAAYGVTPAGMRQLSDGSTELLSDELQLLILLSKATRLRRVVGLFPKFTTQKVLETAGWLAERSYIEEMELPKDDGSISFRFSDALTPASSPRHDEISKEAENARAELQRRGFYVSIARRAARQMPPNAGGRYSVLLIEDDSHLVKLYKKLLSMQDIGARSAGNRAELEEVLSSGPPPDLILLDLNLPDIGGFDILHWLSSHPYLGATPVIVASADTTKESIVRALSLGADGYLTKPIEIDSLTDGIRAALGYPVIDRSTESAWDHVYA